MNSKPILLLGVWAVAWTVARSAEEASPAEPRPAPPPPWGDIELKRQFTDRGTPEQSSRTTLRFEVTPKWMITLFRFDLPFIDEKNGNPTSPRLGDVKLRLDSPSVRWGTLALGGYLETTFPTADPESLGKGKYQLTPAGHVLIPIVEAGQGEPPRRWEMAFDPLVKQVVSVAGDPDFRDINYTELELELKGAWRKKYTLSLKPKIITDWESNAETGAVFELEGGWTISRHWRTLLLLGHALWGRGVPDTYGKQIEITVRFMF